MRRVVSSLVLSAHDLPPGLNVYRVFFITSHVMYCVERRASATLFRFSFDSIESSGHPTRGPDDLPFVFPVYRDGRTLLSSPQCRVVHEQEGPAMHALNPCHQRI